MLPDELILGVQMGTVPREAVMGSIRPVAEQVMPHFS
jgi:hypothetical protein